MYIYIYTVYIYIYMYINTVFVYIYIHIYTVFIYIYIRIYYLYIYIHLYCIYMDCIYIRCTHSGVERIYNWTISCLGVKLVDIPAFPGLYTDMIQASAQGECARIILSPYRMLFLKEHASNPNLQCKFKFPTENIWRCPFNYGVPLDHPIQQRLFHYEF